jgi:hypothetical protein
MRYIPIQSAQKCFQTLNSSLILPLASESCEVFIREEDVVYFHASQKSQVSFQSPIIVHSHTHDISTLHIYCIHSFHLSLLLVPKVMNALCSHNPL